MITIIKNTVTHVEEQTIIVCDYCSKSLQTDINSSMYRGSGQLPPGTYLFRKVTESLGVYSDEDKEFCSKACLISWCTKEKNAEQR